MPAAAVIPAPVAYIKIVAVKKLVVEFNSNSVRFTSVALGRLVLLLDSFRVPFTGCSRWPTSLL